MPENKSINATGLMFEDEKFYLPQNIFYTDKGLLLYYNSYEAASYADGPKELLLSYKEVNEYLAVK
ncbi:RsiV family protein [Flavobacterium sp. LB1P71]|uniref:RsiV family protein n=1 Tax=Flavobacterium sp. LB1P71 TaxID=3401716 RepID=UPI003AAD3BC5